MSNGCVSLALITQAQGAAAENDFLVQWAQESDRAEAAKRTNPEIIRRFLLGRSLVRTLIERTTATDGRACHIVVNDEGKPFVTLASGEAGPAISISHSGALVVAAATDLGMLGVDVEQHRSHRAFDDIAGFAFGPREKQAASATPGDFYRIWCLREAMSKASGRGLAEVVDRIDRVHDAPREGVWQTGDGADRWLLTHQAPKAGYSLAVAVRRDASDDTVEWTENSIDLWWP